MLSAQTSTCTGAVGSLQSVFSGSYHAQTVLGERIQKCLWLLVFYVLMGHLDMDDTYVISLGEHLAWVLVIMMK